MTEFTAIEKWRDYKFGMFIHYGLYSILGEGEWVMFLKPMDKDEYAKLATRFTAEKFDAAHLAGLARRAGMKYMVLTARHHDGFCLFDSKASIDNFTVMTAAAKRDLIREYTDACRAEGLGTGIYYSPMDWRCEGFFFPQMYHNSALRMRAQCHAQVRELMSSYGKIDVLWYDGGEDYWLAHGKRLTGGGPATTTLETPIIPNFWGERELDDMVRGLQPEIVIDNRLGKQEYGDYNTPERRVGNFNVTQPWETCDTISESWGWRPNTQLRSTENVLHLLTDVITGGGNLLLNVSPMGDGSLEPAHEQRLLEIGAWLEKYGEAVYGTRGGPVLNNSEIGGATCKDDKVYFFLKNPACQGVKLPLFGGKAVSVRALTGETLSSSEADGILTVSVESEARAEYLTLIEVTLNAPVKEVFDGFDPHSFDAYIL